MATACAPFGVCPVRARRGSEGCYRGVFSTETVHIAAGLHRHVVHEQATERESE